jgi:hypothetical protein
MLGVTRSLVRCSLAAAAANGPRLPQRDITTALRKRYVKIQNSKIDMSETTYPTPGRGHQFQMNIFGLLMDQDAINELQTHVWNRESFLPTTPAKPLTGQLSDLSDIAQNMAIELKDGSPGLVAKNKLRSSVRERLTEQHFVEARCMQGKVVRCVCTLLIW